MLLHCVPAVPSSTLHDHISGKIQDGTKPGPDPYLNLAEEEEVVSFLLHCRISLYKKAGFGFSPGDPDQEEDISNFISWMVGSF